MKIFLHSLIAALVGGAATSLTTALSDPTIWDHPGRLGTIGLSGALIGVLALLKASPLQQPPPPQLKREERY